jgi:EAL domain-containing protein (putative c-di-GMP-specific phosphodiesterase class I)
VLRPKAQITESCEMVSTPQLTRDLRTALSSGALTLAFQGQFDLQTGAAVPSETSPPDAVEALCRWNHVTLGAVPPDRFIALAERGEFLEEIDTRVFALATEHVARWRRAGYTVGLAVNASPAHFSTRYAGTVLNRLDELGLDPAGVTVEITEAPLPQLRPGMLSAIEALRAEGVAISVDDFDAGGDVAMLETLPIDEVKIDRSLTQRVDAAAEDAISAVVNSSANHGWRVVAEGIETLDDFERSRSRGCHRGQGYLWGLPLPVEQMDVVLAGEA